MKTPPPPLRVIRYAPAPDDEDEFLATHGERIAATLDEAYRRMLRGEPDPMPRQTVAQARAQLGGPSVSPGTALTIPVFRGPGVYVYWLHYDRTSGRGHALYVGKGRVLMDRAGDHLPVKPWAPFARLITLIATESDRAALLLEAQLIRDLEPSGNVGIGTCDSCGARQVKVYPDEHAILPERLCAVCSDREPGEEETP